MGMNVTANCRLVRPATDNDNANDDNDNDTDYSVCF